MDRVGTEYMVFYASNDLYFTSPIFAMELGSVKGLVSPASKRSVGDTYIKVYKYYFGLI